MNQSGTLIRICFKIILGYILSNPFLLGAQNFEQVFQAPGADYTFGKNVLVCSNSDIIVVGGTKSFGITSFEAPYLMRVDQNGGLVWMNILDGLVGRTDRLYNIDYAFDGDILAVGESESFSNGNRDAYIARIDAATGNTIFISHFGGGNTEEVFDILSTPDNGCFISGFTGLGMGGTDAYVIKVDSSGNQQYAAGIGGFTWDNSGEIVPNNSASFFLCGATQSFGILNDIYIMKINTAATSIVGVPLVIGGAGDESVANAIPATGSAVKGLFATGSTDSYGAGNTDMFIARVDSSCNLMWIKTYGGTGSDYGNQIIQLSDGNLLVTGGTTSYGFGAYDIALTKLDTAGNVIWMKTYGCTNNDIGIASAERNTAGLVITGSTMSYNNGLEDVLILNTPFEDSTTCNLQFHTPVVYTWVCNISTGGTLSVFNTPLTAATPTFLTGSPPVYSVCNTISFTSTITMGAINCGTTSATALPTGNFTPYTYAWSNGQNTQTAANLVSGTYTVIISGTPPPCSSVTLIDTATISISIPPALTASIALSNVTCEGIADGTATISPAGGAAPFTYSWLPAMSNTAAADSLAPGNYSCTVTDSSGCSATQSVTISEPDAMTFYITSVNATCGNSDGNAAVISSGGTPTHNYFWPSVNQTTQIATGLAAGTYWCTITDANGCSDSVSATIYDCNDFAFFAPNAFTPDGNGINDVWIPQGIGIDLSGYKLMIFDRWGNLFFETSDVNMGWDGTSRDGTKPVQEDVYVWTVQLYCEFDHSEHNYIGHFSLIR